MFRWTFAAHASEIYAIGTEILKRSRFFTNIIKSFYKSRIPQEIKSPGHPLSSGNVKTRFKAFFKKWHAWIDRPCFYGFHTYRNEIYDIGTEILKRSRFFIKIIESFYKSRIPQEIKSAGQCSVKTRFKALFLKCHSWIRRWRFH